MSDECNDMAEAAWEEYCATCAYEPLRDAIRELEAAWITNGGLVPNFPRPLRLAILTVLAEADNYSP